MNLEQVLDRVKTADLEAALKRRHGGDAWKLSTPQRMAFKRALAEVVEKTGVSGAAILGTDIACRIIAARWTFFTALHDEGFGVNEIRRATGHTIRQIRTGLERRKRLPATKQCSKGGNDEPSHPTTKQP